MGHGFLAAAFAQTGHDPNIWPYNEGAYGDSQRLKIRYYIDPSTLLPAYSIQMGTVPVKYDDGMPAPGGQSPASWMMYSLIEYTYPTQFDEGATQATTSPPSMAVRNWPFPQYTFPGK